MAIVDEKKIIIDNQEFTIRSALPSDAASLRDFVKQVTVDSKYLLRTTAEEFTLTEEQEKAWVQKALDNKSSVIIICLVEGEVVALTDAQGGRRARNAHIAELGTSVSKKWRGKGLGKTMMKELCLWAKEASNIEYLELSVMGDNLRAKKLYNSFGFIKVAELPMSYKFTDGTYQVNVIMRKKV